MPKILALGGSATGTVTATGGALTANSVVLGAGTTDTKVIAGLTTDGSKELDIGAVGVGNGILGLKGTTSGTATLTAPAVAGTAQNPIVSSNALSVPLDTIRSLILGTGTNNGFSIITTSGQNATQFKTQDGGQFASIKPGTIQESSGPLSIIYPSAGIFAALGSAQSLNWGATNAFNATVDANISRITTNTLGIGSGAQGSTAGNLQLGKITNYNAIATVDNGVPTELGHLDLTAQSAAITATTIYTPVATGRFRISIYEKVTTVDGAASTLGGATGTVLTFTDGTDSVAQSITVLMYTQAGVAGLFNAGNTTTTNLNGTAFIYAKTGVAIQIAVGYTSTTPGQMIFAVRATCEAM